MRAVATAQLILNFLARVAWPLVALAVVLLFRSPITAFLHDATEFSAWGATLKRTARQTQDFKETAMAAADAAGAAPAANTSLDPAVQEIEQRLLHLREKAGRDPYSAVLNGSDAVVGIVRQAGTLLLGELPEWNVTTGPADILLAAGAPADVLSAAVKSWDLRMEMVHQGARFDTDSAREYLSAAQQTVHAVANWASQAAATR